MLKDTKIILGITGGIAAYKACDILRRLKRLGAEVVVVMTENAKKFITPLTLETLSENEVVTEMFPKRRFVGIRHVDLAGWADLILIAPATANLIGKIRSGIADDILTTIVISSKAPVLIAPAMNVNMYENPIFQENLSYLEKSGYRFVGPEVGELASGIVAKGRLAEPETIVDEAVKLVTRKRDFEGKSILVTASRTEEPLDPIRYLANRSSGKMGYAIACEAYQRGAKVTLISGPSNLPPPSGLNFIQVKTAKEMLAAVRSAFKRADALIMAAAVSDFSPTLFSKNKIKKDQEEIILKLKPTVDILKEMGKKKKEKILVGFSLETEDEIKNAKKKMTEKNLDLIVVNNPNVSGAGFEVDTNQVTLIDKRGRTEKLPLLSKKEVASKILDKVKLLLRKNRGS
ncbi:MAG: bifunctional phosphopantothenoylcysteine decarboxylase/phosphopantothenate--cysteine ligase CoaBC [candidate division Zixibacteria bacterium]|nr:bifunctional phosphopantothenoylcysteine decarboxylase/phosphopantothenate--cysteine ligase CoaBC [candidate division Zixibacteria bacterium]